MKKRSKNSSSIWHQRIEKMLALHPDSIHVENRQKAIAYLIVQSYPELKEIAPERGYSLIKDICWTERLLRSKNESNQKKLKQKLERDRLLKLGYRFKQETLL